MATSLLHRLTIALVLRMTVLSLTAFLPIASWAGEGFQPISPEELKMTSEPLAPGAPAIILYRQVDRDDHEWLTRGEYHYMRIKILTEAGRKYANVEIPFVKEGENIEHINARSVKPDGSIVNFNGQVFEKNLFKSRRESYLAKVFTIPDVEVGDIIEYFYTADLRHIYNSQWIVSESLFTKTARFSLWRYKSSAYSSVKMNVRWVRQNLPPGAEPKEFPGDIIRMEANNIPAFQSEELMPPANELKARVDFTYDVGLPETDPNKYWQRVGEDWTNRLEKFIDKRKAMEQAVAQIVSPSDPPEAKLRKIYDRLQEFRNKSYELRKTEQEEKREKDKADENVEDIWKRGYGNSSQITWLYLALVRAAGFEAYDCLVSDRAQYFFHPETEQGGKLTANVVLVKLNGKDLYLDPGAEFAPFGVLPWSRSGVPGLRLAKGGVTWIQTTLPQSSDSRGERVAKLKLSDAGDLEGKLTVKYTGLEAMYFRAYLRNSDDVARKKFLEDAVKRQIPVPAQAELTNKPDWGASETPLIVEFDIKVPAWSAGAGKRQMIQAGLFTAQEKHLFEHAERVHPIYLEYPYETLDDIVIELPTGWQVSSVPPAQAKDGHVINYELKVEGNKDTLRVTRKLAVDFLLVEQKYYPALRDFFQAVRTADEEQIVLQPGSTTASN
jgi:hypothetical protein